MSVIIRLQNLPWTASALDIRSYFEGLSIPEGGVRILGGEIGDAFILFSTDEDARKAMLKDRGMLGGVQIRLYLSSRTEMVKVFEDMRSARTKPSITKKEDHINFEEYKIQAGIVEEHTLPSNVSPTIANSTIKTSSKIHDKAKIQTQSNTLNKYELSLLNDIDHSDQGSAEYSPMTPSISYAEYKRRTRDRSRSPRAHYDSDCRDKYESREHERESNNAYALSRETKTNDNELLTNQIESNYTKKCNENLSEKLREISNESWLLALMQNISNKKLVSSIPKLANDDITKEEKSISPLLKNNANLQFSNLTRDNGEKSLNRDKLPIINNYKNNASDVKIHKDFIDNHDDVNNDECNIPRTSTATPVYNKNCMNNSGDTLINEVPLKTAKQSFNNFQDGIKIPQFMYNVPPPALPTLTTNSPYSVAGFPTKINTTLPPPSQIKYCIPNIYNNNKLNNNNDNNHHVPSISNLSKISPTTQISTPKKTTKQNSNNPLNCIQVKLASHAKMSDIRNIFNDISLPMNGIKLQYNTDKRYVGNNEHNSNSVMCIACIKFITEADAQKALLKNHHIYNKNPIFINLISEEEFYEFNATKLSPTTTTSPKITTNINTMSITTSNTNSMKFMNINKKIDKKQELVNNEINVLCVENLTALTEKEHIKAMFAAYGNYDVIMAEQFGNRSGFWAFLKFKNKIAAKAALADINAHTLNGQMVKVRVSSAEEAIASKKAELLAHEKLIRDQQALLNGTDSFSSNLTNDHNDMINNFNNNDNKNDIINMIGDNSNNNKNDNFIIMKNVMYTATQNDVHRMLMVAGFPPNQIELLYNDVNRPKGEIIVEFNDRITAKNAVKDLHNKPFRGRTMRVHSITPQQVADIMQKPCYNYIPRPNFVEI